MWGLKRMSSNCTLQEGSIYLWAPLDTIIMLIIELQPLALKTAAESRGEGTSSNCTPTRGVCLFKGSVRHYANILTNNVIPTPASSIEHSVSC